MPSVSEDQRKAMEAAAHGHSTLGIPEKVGKEFVADDSADVICAGILFRAPGPKFLLVKNADDGQWVQPGGHVENGETLYEAAVRESVEEVGEIPDGFRSLFRSSKSEGVDFTCYIQDVQPFDPVIDSESTDAGWFSPDNLPESIHPEVAKSIAIASGNEIDIAKAIRDGAIYSPQRYENVWLFDMRITGTGTSYRQALDEYVYRPPENFLTQEFVERCNGLPLIFEHPKDSILNTEEFRDRSIGSVILPYIKDDEVRGIAKVFDDDAAELMLTSHISTSPAVVFRNAGSTETLKLDDGSHVLIEGKPSYLDHLAICEEGVWDKGKEPNGINRGDTTVENEKEMPSWADALNQKLDSIHTRMDALEGRGGEKVGGESEEEKLAREEAERKDAAEKERMDAEEKIKADAAEKERMDALSEEDRKKEEDEKARKDAARKDEEYMDSQKRENAELRQRIADMDKRLSAAIKPLSRDDRESLAMAQSRADSVMQMFGDSAAPPMNGESPIDYRKRLVAKLQKHSPGLKTVRMDSLDGAAFDHLEGQIYADAQKAASSPASIQPGRLVARVDTSTGHKVTTYTGDPEACWGPFKSPGVLGTINRNVDKRAN